MTTEEAIIAVVRVLGSLPVLIWPFPGAIIAVLIDLSDLFLKDALHEGGVRHYQSFDKWLDQVYMLTFLVVTLRWRGAERTVGVLLYVYRLAGFALFEVTDERDLLILFPNVFEFWFIFVSGVHFFRIDEASRFSLGGVLPFRATGRQVVIVLAVLTVAKLAQEYVLHVGRWLDGFTAIEAVEAVWRFLTPPY